MSYLGILGKNFFKKLLSYLKPALSNSSNYEISRRNKNVLIQDQKCLIWVFLDLEFAKNIFIFEISTLEYI